METDELKCSWWTNSYNKDENIANVNPPCSLGAISEDDDVSTTLGMSPHAACFLLF